MQYLFSKNNQIEFTVMPNQKQVRQKCVILVVITKPTEHFIAYEINVLFYEI